MVQTNSLKPKIIIIGGTTAVGKTEISLKLAKDLGGEIISCDSMQIYKYATIGTAKIMPEEMQGIKHYMLDFLEPNKEFSAGEFAFKAGEIIKDIVKRGKVPIIVGGTGLYINSLLFPLSATAKRDEAYREKLNNILKTQGKEALYKMLEEIDIDSAKTLHINQTDRIIRALEIYKQTGKKKSELEKTKTSPYNYLMFVLEDNRDIVYERINERAKKMVQDGIIEETQNLIKNYNVTAASPIMKAIGYKESLEYINGKISKEDLADLISLNTRHYAKRQITYFKKMEGANFINRNNYKEILSKSKNFLGIE